MAERPDTDEIRSALRCGQLRCACQRPRGQVHCPAHDDARPSLSITEREGRTLLHCFAGCTQEAVIDALRGRGLWTGRPPAPRVTGLLLDVVRFVQRYLLLPSDHATIAVALWIAHCWVLEAFEVSPYLAILSPEKRSGKTRALEVLELLTPRAWRIVQPSTAVLFRKIKKDHPTLLLDEADAIFSNRGEQYEPLRAVLNAGVRRGNVVPRCVGEGAKQQLVDFEVFCPKAIAAIGDLPDTIRDRSIVIHLDRATPAEQRRLTRLRLRQADEEAAPIREALARWADVATPKLRDARPPVPEELDGRAADGWEVLLAVADQTSDGWSVLAWSAALALSTGAAREDDSLRVRLLADIRRVFNERQTDRLTTADLIEGLCEDDSAPWEDLRGRQITPQTLARLLRPFGIRPGTVRVGEGDNTAKGYKREDFEDTWDRYLPLPPASHPSQASQPALDVGFGDFSDPSHTHIVTDAKSEGSRLQMRSVTDVTDKTTSTEEEPLATPEDSARAGGRGQLLLRIGEGRKWHPYPYAPGIAIAGGKRAWLTFMRNNPPEELERAVEAMRADPFLNGRAQLVSEEGGA